jgi:hypothetical protein
MPKRAWIVNNNIRGKTPHPLLADFRAKKAVRTEKIIDEMANPVYIAGIAAS